jgi:ComF family protein
VLRVAIHQFKYGGVRALAQPLGELMGRTWATLAPQDEPVDLIVPVPLHPARQRERGYNQAALLAQKLGGLLICPVETEVLVRIRATLPQVGLSAGERRANVQGAFQLVEDMVSYVAGKRVLLVDDVYTTGSTLEAACDALRDGRVLSVWAFTLARAGKDSVSPT